MSSNTKVYLIFKNENTAQAGCAFVQLCWDRDSAEKWVSAREQASEYFIEEYETPGEK